MHAVGGRKGVCKVTVHKVCALVCVRSYIIMTAGLCREWGGGGDRGEGGISTPSPHENR